MFGRLRPASLVAWNNTTSSKQCNHISQFFLKFLAMMFLNRPQCAGPDFPVARKFSGERLYMQGYDFGDGGAPAGSLFHRGVSYSSRVPEEGPPPHPVIFSGSYPGGLDNISFFRGRWPVWPACQNAHFVRESVTNRSALASKLLRVR